MQLFVVKIHAYLHNYFEYKSEARFLINYIFIMHQLKCCNETTHAFKFQLCEAFFPQLTFAQFINVTTYNLSNDLKQFTFNIFVVYKLYAC